MKKLIPLHNGYIYATESDSNFIEVTDEQFQLFNEGYLVWDESLTCLVENIKREEQIRAEEDNLRNLALDALRLERAKLLDAFDILKTNAAWGLVTISAEEKDAVNQWYQLALDLDENAIKNPPELIVKYL